MELEKIQKEFPSDEFLKLAQQDGTEEELEPYSEFSSLIQDKIAQAKMNMVNMDAISDLSDSPEDFEANLNSNLEYQRELEKEKARIKVEFEKNNIFSKTMTATELVNSEDFSDDKEWLVDNIIPVGQLGMIIAPQKSLKSSLALDLALALTSGSKFMNENIKEAGKVLFIQNENTPMTEHTRLKKVHHTITDNLTFLHGGAFRLDNDEHIEQLKEKIELENIKTVIIDPLKDCLTDVEILNNNQKMNEIFKKLRDVRNCNNGMTTIILVLHATKSVLSASQAEKGYIVTPDKALGASAIGDNYEFCLTLSSKISAKSNNTYSVITVFARNYAYHKNVSCGYTKNGEFIYHLEKEKEEEEELPKQKPMTATQAELSKVVEEHDRLQESLERDENSPESIARELRHQLYSKKRLDLSKVTKENQSEIMEIIEEKGKDEKNQSKINQLRLLYKQVSDLF